MKIWGTIRAFSLFAAACMIGLTPSRGQTVTPNHVTASEKSTLISGVVNKFWGGGIEKSEDIMIPADEKVCNRIKDLALRSPNLGKGGHSSGDIPSELLPHRWATADGGRFIPYLTLVTCAHYGKPYSTACYQFSTSIFNDEKGGEHLLLKVAQVDEANNKDVVLNQFFEIKGARSLVKMNEELIDPVPITVDGIRMAANMYIKKGPLRQILRKRQLLANLEIARSTSDESVMPGQFKICDIDFYNR